MAERAGAVTSGGNPLTLVGEEPALGEAAPDFVAVANDMSPVRLSDFKGKVVLLASVPSLDTGVCDTMTHRFNEAVSALDDGVVGLTISMDLPPAQKRWCGAAGVERVQTISDHRDASFGQAYGMLIKEIRFLARGVHVIDRDGILRYRELVEEIGDQPDYDAALAAVNELI